MEAILVPGVGPFGVLDLFRDRPSCRGEVLLGATSLWDLLVRDVAI
jgi:hypothetical protein